MRRSTELWLIVPDIVPAIVPATVPSTHYMIWYFMHSTSYSTQNGYYVQYPFWVLYSFFTVPAIVPQMGTVHSTGFGYYIVPSTVPKNRVLRSTPWVLYSTRQGSHPAWFCSWAASSPPSLVNSHLPCVFSRSP